MHHRLTAVVLSLAFSAVAASNTPNVQTPTLRLDPTTASSCLEWDSLYQTHWMKLPECHDGTASGSCCELYDLMARSIRVFNDKLDCQFTDFHKYSVKFSSHCSNMERVDSGLTDARTDTRTIKDPSLNHGSGPVQILDSGDEPKPVGHTGSGGCTGGHCPGHQPYVPGCQGGNCGSGGGCTSGHCGGQTYVPGCQSGHCGGGCSSGHCGGGCTSGHCGQHKPYVPGCQGGHCGSGSGCSGGNCGKPVGACVGINCGCTVCVGQQSGTGGQPNQGPIVLPDDDNDVCFHGDGLVELQDGGVKLMKHLSVGDMVHVGGGKFSEVFMFTHQDADKRSTYVKMTVDSGKWIMVTPTHYMYSDKGLQLAGELNEGDTVEMQDGKLEKIVERSVVYDKGLYNPQTLHGDIVVNGFRASTYTKTIEYETAHSLLAPLRAMYRICGAHISRAF